MIMERTLCWHFDLVLSASEKSAEGDIGVSDTVLASG